MKQKVLGFMGYHIFITSQQLLCLFQMGWNKNKTKGLKLHQKTMCGLSRLQSAWLLSGHHCRSCNIITDVHAILWGIDSPKILYELLPVGPQTHVGVEHYFWQELFHMFCDHPQ